MKTRSVMCVATLLLLMSAVMAQTSESGSEKRVSLSEAALALDAGGSPALEATLRTTALNGAIDTPVTNIRLVLKNVSPVFYSYVSGVVGFYDAAGVRCGDGLFKADVLAPNESAETDAPGIRIKCAPATWRIVATSLVTRASASILTDATPSGSSRNLIISVDGEDHPIQLDKPMVLTLGSTRRTIVVKQSQ